MLMPAPMFPGVRTPGSDFNAVRTDLQTKLMPFELSLATARNKAANTALLLNVAGNAFFVDQKANSGVASVVLNDEALNEGNLGVTVYPGFAINGFPFTQILIENEAQPGLSLRFFIGTDVDFTPSVAAGVSVINAVNINDIVQPTCRHENVSAGLGIGFNVVQLIAPGTGAPNGFLVRSSYVAGAAGAGGSVGVGLIAAAAAPANFNSAANELVLNFAFVNVTTYTDRLVGPMQRRLPGGWGLWACSAPATAAATIASVQAEFEIL